MKNWYRRRIHETVQNTFGQQCISLSCLDNQIHETLMKNGSLSKQNSLDIFVYFHQQKVVAGRPLPLVVKSRWRVQAICKVTTFLMRLIASEPRVRDFVRKEHHHGGMVIRYGMQKRWNCLQVLGSPLSCFTNYVRLLQFTMSSIFPYSHWIVSSFTVQKHCLAAYLQLLDHTQEFRKYCAISARVTEARNL